MTAVSKVTLNGTTLMDATTATASANEIISPYTAMTADGVMTTGTASAGGGDEWVRPADFPDLSKMDISGEVLYLSYMANEANGFCSLWEATNSGQYVVEIGDIVGDEFVAENTYSFNSGAKCEHYFGTPNGGYKVLRVTGNIKEMQVVYSGDVTTAEGEKRSAQTQGLVEIYGNLPHHNGKFECRGIRHVESIVVRHLNPTNLYYSFDTDSQLQNIETETWDLSNCTSLNHTFAYCSKLPSIDLDGWNTSKVTNMERTFDSCMELKELDVSKWDVSNVTTMCYAFSNSGITQIDVTGWDVHNVTNMNGMFSTCTSLEELDLSTWNTSKVTAFDSFCNSCYSLKKISAKNLVTATATSINSIMKACWVLRELDNSGWDTSNVKNIGDAFSNSHSLTVFPFNNCDLSSVTNSTAVIMYDERIFDIEIPASLSVIGNYAFYASKAWSEIHFRATTPPILNNTNAFSDMTLYGGRKIYVPYSADHSVLDAYKTATNWSTYASYIVEEDA